MSPAGARPSDLLTENKVTWTSRVNWAYGMTPKSNPRISSCNEKSFSRCGGILLKPLTYNWLEIPGQHCRGSGRQLRMRWDHVASQEGPAELGLQQMTGILIMGFSILSYLVSPCGFAEMLVNGSESSPKNHHVRRQINCPKSDSRLIYIWRTWHSRSQRRFFWIHWREKLTTGVWDRRNFWQLNYIF